MTDREAQKQIDRLNRETLRARVAAGSQYTAAGYEVRDATVSEWFAAVRAAQPDGQALFCHLSDCQA